MPNPPTPIFVLGGARNGTTWLSNLLGLHPRVASVHHELHHGSHESNIFRQHRYYGDLSDTDAYIRFAQLFATEDYFRIAGGDPARLYQKRYPDFYTAFFDLMDELARREGRTHWTTKLDPLFALDPPRYREFRAALGRRYPTVKWVGIQRRGVACLNSYLFMEGQNNAARTRSRASRLAALTLGAARYVAQYRFLNGVLEEERGFAMTFGELQREREATGQRLDAYLSLANSLAVGVPDQYAKNTSFKGRTRDGSLTSGERQYAAALLATYRAAPWLARAVYSTHENRIKGIRDPSYRKLLKRQHFGDEFRDELGRVGASDLLERLDHATDDDARP